MPRFGRIPMQVAGFGGMALGMLLLLCAALIGDKDTMHLAFVVGGFVLFNFAMNAGPNATTFAFGARSLSYGDPRRGKQIWRGERKGWRHL